MIGTGTEEYNLALGDLRANIALYLEDLGIDKARVNTVSLGSLEATITVKICSEKRPKSGTHSPKVGTYSPLSNTMLLGAGS